MCCSEYFGLKQIHVSYILAILYFIFDISLLQHQSTWYWYQQLLSLQTTILRRYWY